MAEHISFFDKMPLGIQRFILHGWYEVIARMDRDADLIFMNYGYASTNTLPQHSASDPYYFSRNLYDAVVGDITLTDQHVLEVGCGHGGGAVHLFQKHRPKTYVGLDRTHSAIKKNQAWQANSSLNFVRGRADRLPYPDQSFGRVINIESSHNYPSMEEFLTETYRILENDGYFLFADFRGLEGIKTLPEMFTSAGFEIKVHKNITSNILAACDLDTPRRLQLITEKVPVFLQEFFHNFAGIKDSNGSYRKFKNGEFEYHRFILQKKGH